MKPLGPLAMILLLAVTPGRLPAQSLPSEVQTAGGLHTAVFRTAQGSVGVSIAADAAPGDTISGVVRADAAGRTPQEQQKNLVELNALSVEWQGQRTAVSDRRYRWVIPTTLRSGRVMLMLRARDGRIVSQAAVPIDGVPAPSIAQPSGRDAFELPTDVQAGLPAVIRGPLDGTLAGKAVRVGDTAADLLASSPRRLVFRVPASQAGPRPLRFTSTGITAESTVRVLTVRLVLTATQLPRGEQGTLTIVVGGLQNLAEPLTMVIRNFSPEAVRVQDGDVQRVAIMPRQVRPDGTVTLTRALTGVRPAAFQIVATVSGPPLTLFDVPRAAGRVLTTWEAATGIRIVPAARDLIQRSVLDARGPLEQFLTAQQANLGDPRDLFAALLSNYCFDLRDEKPRPASRSVSDVSPSGIRVVTFAQPGRGAADVEIDTNDVRRLSFRESLTRLVDRFSGSQAVGYLLITSVPPSAGITIDGQRKSEMTNRRFVTSIGEHAVVITGPGKTCQERVQVGAFQNTVVTCEP